MSVRFARSGTVLGPILSMVFLCSACGASQPKQTDYSDEEAKPTSVQPIGGGSSSATSKLVKIPVSVQYGSFGLLGTAATAYSVTLSSCLSGYSATVDQTSADGIEAYKDDRSCLAKLTSLTTGGVTYTSTDTGATDFTTWAANDTALFASSGGATIRVKVISQLNSPISGTEAVVYNFSELLDGQGDYTFSEASVSDAHAITVESQEAPRFNVVGATFMGMDDTTGAPEMKFKLECVDDPTAGSPTSVAMSAGSAADTLCGSVDLNAISYKLVKDTFSSVLTISQAESQMSSGTSTITIPTDQYQTDATHEGFNTVTLDGPGPLGTAGNEAMILILKAGLSVTYFNIDITTITQ